MKKIMLILILIFLLSIVLIFSLETTSSTYTANLYFGNGGYIGRTNTMRVGTGIGQTVIGKISTQAYSYAVFYGIFHINTTYSIPPPLYLPFIYGIYSYDMENIILNWSGINESALGPSTC